MNAKRVADRSRCVASRDGFHRFLDDVLAVLDEQSAPAVMFLIAEVIIGRLARVRKIDPAE